MSTMTQEHLQEARSWADAVIAGESLRSIGQRVGCTGENVRQRIRKAGLEAEVEAGRAARVAAEREELIRARAARQEQVRLSVRTYPAPGDPWYSDEEIIETLRDWLRSGGSGTSTDYLASGRLPSTALIVNRFGWNNAIRAAGGTPSRPNRGQRHRKDYVPESVCLDAVVRFLTDPGESRGGIVAYHEWAMRNAEPGSLTVRHRFGSWQAAKRAALAVLSRPSSGVPV